MWSPFKRSFKLSRHAVDGMSECHLVFLGSKPLGCHLDEDRKCGFVYTDRRSRSEPAHVDPSLRRRMSCWVTLLA